DAIRELVKRLVDAAHREGTFTESVAIEIERQWRLENAGARVTISYRNDPRKTDKTVDSIRTEYLSNTPVEDIINRHGISRATLYRYLKK
ncbi:MAG: helix-turn-helix domain-containing protein, partial [Pseudomonas sp.]|nr:helix-turn-helix domain-containing protein [Pseudomonas sp.]